jgi:hypothetical protein
MHIKYDSFLFTSFSQNFNKLMIFVKFIQCHFHANISMVAQLLRAEGHRDLWNYWLWFCNVLLRTVKNFLYHYHSANHRN